MSSKKWDYCDCHSTLPEDEELDFFDMVRYRSWDVHPESLAKNLEEETMAYYFRYWYGLGDINNFRNSRGFWQYTPSSSKKKQATFCSMRIKSITLDNDDSPTTTTTTTTKTTNPTTTKPTTKPTTITTTTITPTTPEPDSCTMRRVRPKPGSGRCTRLEDDEELHMRATYSSDELTEGVKAATKCSKGYKLNLFPEKIMTAAYCRCDENGTCNWKFSKGRV